MVTSSSTSLFSKHFIAHTATAVFSLNGALAIDLYPGKLASAIAVNNLIRCLIGAAGVAVVQMIIDVLGPGVTFLVFAGVNLGCSQCLSAQ